jgi:predicted XRE-type DNA-binding protein
MSKDAQTFADAFSLDALVNMVAACGRQVHIELVAT